ncbi:uncharacterized protein LOC107759860 isoform X1 [Nicotiana tabacum]|uniref:Uncharacterized protein LOC107759860 isoform X1 n=1 Tax=Nicotiana tabacum TaxID=4097 RepID=A0A1S3X0Z4_TOBAC|nr:putative protein TPRXL isoform X1 [Nicotiana tomentosiformis]XP_016433358.1 PREDICTED: putative protein TPRXL isoform X1 [Nicotiana tabacum]
MGSDSILNGSIPITSSNPKDFAKKKRANRSAKLKQCKLDARREQWLSQVKNKGLKEEPNAGGTHSRAKNVESERRRLIEKLQIKPRGEEDNEGASNHYSDSDSPTSHTSSVLGGNDSGTNFTGSSSSSSSCTSSSSGGCCSGSMSEEDDDCLDDWEAVADALAATDHKQEQHNPSLDSHCERDDNVAHMSSRQVTSNRQVSESNDRGLAPRPPLSSQAWRPDDTFRPPSLPTLSKQYSFPMNSERHCRGGSVWGCKSLSSIPTSCPICCEDLDFTDTSFLPCSCGFRLCLFCHKRILEEDGRCPGCRKQYVQDPVEREATIDGGSLTVRLTRSCSMISRS